MNAYDYLAAEKTELEEILSGIPSASVIERASFEARLEAVRAELSGIERPAPSSKEAAPAFHRGTDRQSTRRDGAG